MPGEVFLQKRLEALVGAAALGVLGSAPASISVATTSGPCGKNPGQSVAACSGVPEPPLSSTMRAAASPGCSRSSTVSGPTSPAWIASTSARATGSLRGSLSSWPPVASAACSSGMTAAFPPRARQPCGERTLHPQAQPGSPPAGRCPGRVHPGHGPTDQQPVAVRGAGGWRAVRRPETATWHGRGGASDGGVLPDPAQIAIRRHVCGGRGYR